MEKQLIPKLRLPYYNDNWNKVVFDNITTKISDGIHSTPNYDINGDYYFVNGNNLVDGVITVYENTKKVSSEEFIRHKRPLSKSSILLSINGTIGNLAFYNDEKIVLGKSACYINLNKELPISFYYYILQTPKIKKYFLSELTGSTIMNLSLSTVKKTRLIVPSLPEQQKIASFLSDVDEVITKLTKKKTLLEQYKKGIMQKIFNQELRFKDDNGNEFPKWQEKKLCKISNITTGSSNRQDSGLDGEFTFFDRSEDIRTSSRYLFDGEAIIVAGEGSDFIPKYYIGKFDLHQRTYAIMEFKEVISKYLFYYIHFHRRYFLSQAVGSTVKSLRLPMFQKMLIKLPVKEEQTKIANFLSDIDAKIEALNTKIENSKAFKKGLLQQMFV